MRIISGRLKGKRIVAPGNLPVRPTTDFAKEGLFNILHNNFDFEDLQVLDLFCGTGNISFEFSSRGAAIMAVDADYGCHRFVSKTADQLGFDQLIPIKSDVFKFIAACNQSFDLVFADPPYDLPEFPELIESIIQKGLVKPEGWLVIEHDKRHDFSGIPQFEKVRKYGKVNFSLFLC